MTGHITASNTASTKASQAAVYCLTSYNVQCSPSVPIPELRTAHVHTVRIHSTVHYTTVRIPHVCTVQYGQLQYGHHTGLIPHVRTAQDAYCAYCTIRIPHVCHSDCTLQHIKCSTASNRTYPTVLPARVTMTRVTRARPFKQHIVEPLHQASTPQANSSSLCQNSVDRPARQV